MIQNQRKIALSNFANLIAQDYSINNVTYLLNFRR